MCLAVGAERGNHIVDLIALILLVVFIVLVVAIVLYVGGGLIGTLGGRR